MKVIIDQLQNRVRAPGLTVFRTDMSSDIRFVPVPGMPCEMQETTTPMPIPDQIGSQRSNPKNWF